MCDKANAFALLQFPSKNSCISKSKFERETIRAAFSRSNVTR